MNYLEFWYMALRTPAGIVLRVDNPEAVRQKLYTARREACDLDLDKLSVAISPTDSGELWIVWNAKAAESAT